jgi:predicted PurR-regulated permease PerM
MPPKKQKKVSVNLGFKQALAGFADNLRNMLKSSEQMEEEVLTLPKKAKEASKVMVAFDLVNVAKVTLVVLALLVAAYFVYEIRQIVLILFVSFLFASALMPTVDFLQKKKVPRALSVLVIYVVVITFLVAFISSFIPTLGKELVKLARNLQEALVGLTQGGVNIPALNFILEPLQDFDVKTLSANLEQYLLSIGKQLSSLAGNAVGFLIALSNGLLNFLLVLVLTFMFVVGRDDVNQFIVSLFPKEYESYILNKNKAIQVKIGYWLQGQVVLMVVIGLITYIGLSIIGVDYALTLAAFTGLAELLPVVGPMLALIVALPIAANKAFWMVGAVFIFYMVIQQLENNLLVPAIMKKAVGLNPIVVIVSMLIGFQFLGVLGLIISVPVATMVGLFLADFLRKK